MCDIDKALVLRGAAHMSTYAAEREPPRLDPFTAGLIAQALRAKLGPQASQWKHSIEPAKNGTNGVTATEKPYYLKSRSRQVYDFLKSRGSDGATPGVVSKSLGIPTGSVYYPLRVLVGERFATIDANNIYRLTGREPASLGSDDRRKAARVAHAPSNGSQLRETWDMLEAHHKKGAPHTTDFQARVAHVLRCEPTRVFQSAEIAKAVRCSVSAGKLFGALTKAVDAKLAVKHGPGLYQWKVPGE